MAKEFYLIENYKKNGKIGISHQVFEEIARYVTVEVDGVEFLEDLVQDFGVSKRKEEET